MAAARPAPGHGVHRYAFQLFALSGKSASGSTPGREAVMDMLENHAIASGLLIGTYERPDGTIRVKDTEKPAALDPSGLTGT